MYEVGPPSMSQGLEIPVCPPRGGCSSHGGIPQLIPQESVQFGRCLCNLHSIHGPPFPCPVSSATGDREPHPQTLPEQPGACRSGVKTACWGLRYSGNKTVDPELGKPRTGFKGSSWTDSGRGSFPRGTNKPSAHNLKDFTVLPQGPPGGDGYPVVSHPLPQHPQVVDDYSAKKVSCVFECHLQLVHLGSWHREGVSTGSQGK